MPSRPAARLCRAETITVAREPRSSAINSLPRHGSQLDAELLGPALALARPEAAACCDQPRRVVEDLDVPRGIALGGAGEVSVSMPPSASGTFRTMPNSVGFHSFSHLGICA